MRLNFNLKTTYSNHMPTWLSDEQHRWLKEYDLDVAYTNPWVVEYIWSPKGAINFSLWLRLQGFKVNYYEVDYLNEDSKLPVAFGLEFDESCPKFVLEQLKDES